MLHSKRILFLWIILSVAISSCNLPAGIIPAGTKPPDLIATITAQALLLQTPTQTLAVVEVQAESNTPTATNTPEAVPSIAITETALPTSTAGIATVTVSAETNCRSGPSISYPSDYSLPIGQSAEVIGKNTPTNYWIINVPGKAGATCWLWGKYATVSGDTSGLKEYEIPATPIPTLPTAVSNLSEQNICVNGAEFTQNVSGTITWKDNSNNEKGFNIYQRLNGANWSDILVGSVGPNVTGFNFNVQTLSKAPFSLKVEAYNDAGTSQRKAINIAFNCP